MSVKVAPIQSKETCPTGTNTGKKKQNLFYSFLVYFFVMQPAEYAAIKFLSLNFSELS